MDKIIEFEKLQLDIKEVYYLHELLSEELERLFEAYDEEVGETEYLTFIGDLKNQLESSPLFGVYNEEE